MHIRRASKDVVDNEDMLYELNITPRASLDSQQSSTLDKAPHPSTLPSSTDITPSSHTPPAPGPHHQPTLRLLFSLLPRRHRILLLTPAILSSLISGSIAPFMTYVVGQAFNAFSLFPTTPNPPQAAVDALYRGVGLAALELVGLAVASFALGSVTSSLWIWVGEINVLMLRRRVYDAVTNKEMEWFDLNVGSGGDTEQQDGEGSVGAGGLMAKFSRETDDVRMASSLAAGTTLQYLTTCLACLALAFSRSWSLTLIILSSVPLLILIQAFSQSLAGPLLQHERDETARAATTVERAVASLPTLKAFSAAPFELSRAESSFGKLQKAAKTLNGVWGLTSGMSQFVMMAMFVQGFWYGARVVREGRCSAGDVMAVFWACLIATSNLQMCVPMLITMTKGKMAMVGMMQLVGDDDVGSSESSQRRFSKRFSFASNTETPFPPVTTTTAPSKSRTLRKITPLKCHGELALHNITFAYPSRPTLPVLSDVSLFLPAHEMTFIVGSSGSGKSTVAQLLLRMYQPSQGQSNREGGMILLDEQDMRFLDEKWVRRHVVGVGQQGASGVVVLEGRSVWENVLVGLRDSDWLLGPLPSSPTKDASSSPRESAKGSPRTRQDETPTTYDTAPPELRAKVESAARTALLHEFVRDLPQGWDTILGSGNGVGLSGGQKQRLALARAVLRDPGVLILDEPTSALDPTTRLLVFSALKASRANKTTIVITHDLSQIEPGDFVYVMRAGRVVEGGYRCDLEKALDEEGGDMEGRGEFRKMLESQMRMEGGAPEATEEPGTPFPFGPSAGAGGGFPAELTAGDEEEEDEGEEEGVDLPQSHQPTLAAIPMRPLTWGNWMFEVVADLTGATSLRHSRFGSSEEEGNVTQDDAEKGYATRFSATQQQQKLAYKKRRPSSISIVIPQPRSPIAEESEEEDSATPRTPSMVKPKRRSLQFTPSSTATSFTAVNSLSYQYSKSASARYGVDKAMEMEMEMEYVLEEKEFEDEKRVVERSGLAITQGRVRRERGGRRERTRWDGDLEMSVRVGGGGGEDGEKEGEKEKEKEKDSAQRQDEAPPAFWSLVRAVLPTIPNKPLLILGLILSVLSGAMTPVFSFLLSRLMFEVSIGATQVGTINFLGGLVLGIAAMDGVFLGAKYFVMESVGMLWVTKMRTRSLKGVLRQDMAFFDSPANEASPVRLAQVIVRDGDDARNLISIVFAQFLVVTAMLGVGLVWALVQGWQLTLAGVAIAPVFGGVMAWQTRLVAGCEVRNKRAREEVARGYYEAIINVRAIRSMSFDPIFRNQFLSATDRALSTGVRGAFVEGCTYGVSSGLIYLAEALLFYVGAVLVGRGMYTYLRMVEVLNLVVFSVTIGSQLMAFTTRIAKAVQATADFNKLLHLPSTTSESTGTLEPPLMSGPIKFTNVSFAYPSRPTQPVLKNLNLTIHPGECVALVGSSGSGKSTVAALLQRLYEPSEGCVSVGGEETSLGDVNVGWLRRHLGVVSQQMSLLDASVADNVRYGGVPALSSSPPSSASDKSEEIVISDVAIRAAAKKARVHDFVMGLPQGYDTSLGENAALISGGQAQRLMIARALAREESQAQAGGRILVLDECTSALDAENQTAILESIRSLHSPDQDGEKKVTTTTIMVTHKLPVMQMCDRIVVLHQGEIAEEGTYKELMERKGVFANLASGGEWVGE